MFQKCDKCGKGIGFNEAYVAITYNLQKQTHDTATQQNVIDIKHSEIVMVFCGSCGNQHNARMMSDALELKEVVYQEIPSPETPATATPKVDVTPDAQFENCKKELSKNQDLGFLKYPAWLYSSLQKLVEENDITYEEAYESIEGLVTSFT